MNAITKLTSTINDPRVSSLNKLTEICKTIDIAVPHANRISLWRFLGEGEEIECLKVLDPFNESTEGQILRQEDFPIYFEHIKNNQVVLASDARHNYVTKCFNQDYFEPLNIYSLLDFVIHNEHKPAGIICCERVGDQICWDKTDKVAIKRIANVMSLYISGEFESCELNKPS